jgi:hypothetical protein
MSAKAVIDWRIQTNGAAGWNMHWEKKYAGNWRLTSKGLVPENPVPAEVPLRVQNLIPNLQAHVDWERAEQLKAQPTYVIQNELGETTNITTNARHAKRLAGWPSGEWQGIKEVT